MTQNSNETNPQLQQVVFLIPHGIKESVSEGKSKYGEAVLTDCKYHHSFVQLKKIHDHARTLTDGSPHRAQEGAALSGLLER